MTVRYDEKMVITGIGFAMALVSKCGCLLARILSDGRTVSICRGGMFFDEMRGQYVNIPIVEFMGDQALSANVVLYEVEMTPEEQIAMMKTMSMQR